MRAKRISSDEQFRLIMECRQSGLSDYQWCQANDINQGTFYNWIKILLCEPDSRLKMMTSRLNWHGSIKSILVP